MPPTQFSNPSLFFTKHQFYAESAKKKPLFLCNLQVLKIPFVKKSEPFVVKSVTQASSIGLPKKTVFFDTFFILTLEV